MNDRSVHVGNLVNGIVVTGSDKTISVVFGDTGIGLPLDPRHRRRPARLRGHRGGSEARELDILAPDANVLPLVGRKALLAEMLDWLASDELVSVHAITGPAGTGKTRLALELCHRIDPTDSLEGWAAGFVSADRLIPVVDALETRRIAWSRPTLVVVDYAARAGAALGRWLDRMAADPGAGRVRFLLLEREADPERGWWRSLARPRLAAEWGRLRLIAEGAPLALPGLGDVEARRTLVAAAQAAARALRPDLPPPSPIPRPGADVRFDAALASPRFASPLSCVMAGALALRRPPADAMSLRRRDAARRLAERELARLERLAASRGIDAGPLAHVIAFNALAGGLPLSGLRGRLAAELSAAHRDQTKAEALEGLLREEYASPSAADGARSGPIGAHLQTTQPDLVGEAMVLEALSHEDDEECGKLVARAYAAMPARAGPALVRLTQDYAYLDEGSASEAEIETARRITAWLTRLALEIDVPIALEPLGEALPEETIALAEPAWIITRRLAEGAYAAMAEDAPSRMRAAIWLSNLANRSAALGRTEHGIEVGGIALAIWRGLHDDFPGEFVVETATALSQAALSIKLTGSSEAADTAELAVAMLLHAGDLDTERGRVALAEALLNAGVCLSRAGFGAKALERAQAAVDCYRLLVEVRPDAYERDLARALSNFSAGAGDRRDYGSALAAAREAVEIARRSAAETPDGFTESLALALNNASAACADLGMHDEALAFAEETARVFRGLAGDRPSRFAYRAAQAAFNLGKSYTNHGRIDDAITAFREAIARYAATGKAEPHLAETAIVYDDLAMALGKTGHADEAVAAHEAAYALLRRRRANTRSEHDFAAPRILTNVAVTLFASGRREEASHVIADAVAEARVLLPQDPHRIASDLAGALGYAAKVRGADGDSAGARRDLEEALGLLARLHEREPGVHARAITRCLER